MPEESVGGKNMILEFAPNTYMLEYQNGAYLCNGTKWIEAPLNLKTLEEETTPPVPRHHACLYR